MSAATNVAVFAPMAPAAGRQMQQVARPDDGAPRNEAEVNALLARRQREANEAAANPPPQTWDPDELTPPSLAPSGPATSLASLNEAQEARRIAELPPPPPPQPKPVLPPPNETEARSYLARAIATRDAAVAAVPAAEDALSKARQIEAEAEATTAASVTTEMRGGNDLARRIVEWTANGGERPDLSPDADSLDARRDRDRARVHADAARQAAAALAVDLDGKRAVAASAEHAVTAAAAEVVSAMIENVAQAGEAAERQYRRAQMASRAVYDMGTTHNALGNFAAKRTIRARPTMLRLGQGGHLMPLQPTTQSGQQSEHAAVWSELQAALRADPAATLPDDYEV